ncbi:MAG: hypothetical protein RRB13_13120 [bacterium]|nr:hypothetical protein [bacterium]
MNRPHTFAKTNNSVPLASVHPEPANEDNHRLRQLVVLSMHLSSILWRKASQRGRAELAMESGLWTVIAQVGGKLLTQTMDRHFSLVTLPVEPNYRSVILTAKYVLRAAEGLSWSEEAEKLELVCSELERRLKGF